MVNAGAAGAIAAANVRRALDEDEKITENENFFNPTQMVPNADNLLAMTTAGTKISISTVATPLEFTE